MGIRRVVTGHTANGTAVFVTDEQVSVRPVGNAGSATIHVWGRDDIAHFPDDGSAPRRAAPGFPPPGGCNVSVMELAPTGDDFNEFVRKALAPWADPDAPGMHRTATLDYDVVLEGTVGLELDDGAEVTLHPGDVVVMNGTRHRWHNRGDKVARVLSVTIGAYNAIEGGRPVDIQGRSA